MVSPPCFSFSDGSIWERSQKKIRGISRKIQEKVQLLMSSLSSAASKEGVAQLLGRVRLWPDSPAINWEEPLPSDESFHRGKLNNGLAYFIQENDSSSHEVLLKLAVKVGSVGEEEGEHGLAHLVEHVLFEETESFSKENAPELFLSSRGCRLGPHFNGQTGMDRTIYTFSIPSDDPDLLDQMLLLISDFAGRATFPSAGVEKEKRVVLDELRLREGDAAKRARALFARVYQGAYADQFPAGKAEVVREATVEQLQAFYEKWYRPELMALTVVGDVSPERVESKIQKHFSSLSNGEERKVLPPALLKRGKGVETWAHEDKSLNLSLIEATLKLDVEERKKWVVQDLKDALLWQGVLVWVNRKLEQALMDEESPMMEARVAMGGGFPGVATVALSGSCCSGGERAAAAALFRNFLEVQNRGLGESELESLKREIRRDLQLELTGLSGRSHSFFSQRFLGHVLDGDSLSSLGWCKEKELEIVETFSVGDFNDKLRSLNLGADTLLSVFCSGADRDLVEVEKEVGKAVSVELAKERSLVSEESPVFPDLFSVSPKPGVIVSEVYHEDLDLTVLHLGNGAEVMLKVTDFDPGVVLMGAVAHKGKLHLDPKDYGSSFFLNGWRSGCGVGGVPAEAWDEALSGAQVDLISEVGLQFRSLTGVSSKQDLAKLLQLVHHFFSHEEDSKRVFKKIQKVNLSVAEKQERSPALPMDQAIRRIEGGGHSLFEHQTPQQVREGDYQRVRELSQTAFNNPGEFTFSFSGDFNLEQMKKWVAQYLGSLSQKSSNSNWNGSVNEVKLAPGLRVEEVRSGLENKASLHFYFPAPSFTVEKERIRYSLAVQLLEKRLQNKIRMEKGETYCVASRLKYFSFPDSTEGNLKIELSVDPEKAHDVRKLVEEELHRLREEGVTEEEVTQQQKEWVRTREKNFKTNCYWSDLLPILVREKTPLSILPLVDQWIRECHLEGEGGRFFLKEFQDLLSVSQRSTLVQLPLLPGE